MPILHIVNMSSTGRRARITICIHTSVMMIGPQINNGIVLRKNSPNYVSRFSFSLFWVFANLPFTVIPFAVACFCYCLNSRKFILAIVSFRIFLTENTFGCYAFCSVDTISCYCMGPFIKCRKLFLCQIHVNDTAIENSLHIGVNASSLLWPDLNSSFSWNSKFEFVNHKTTYVWPH